MNDLFDILQGEDSSDRRIPGVAIAVVTNNQDPDGEARIKVQYPWRDIEDESYWARILTPMAGSEMGVYFLPEVGDEVLVAFKNGDIDHPVVIGSLWSGKMKPPETNDDGENNRRLIKSRSGHWLIFDDTDGKEKIEIIDKSEKNKITIDTQKNTITIETDKDIELKAPKGKISMEATEITMNSKASTKIEAGGPMDVKSNAILTLKGSLVKIN